jgi:hypothetical protein
MFYPPNDNNNNNNDNINNDTLTICPTSRSLSLLPNLSSSSYMLVIFSSSLIRHKEIIRHSVFGMAFVCPVEDCEEAELTFNNIKTRRALN